MLLDNAERIEIISKQAVYISERIDGDYTLKLHQIDKFYIEKEWHTKFNERRSYTSFTSEDRLKPYLDKIDLSYTTTK